MKIMKRQDSDENIHSLKLSVHLVCVCRQAWNQLYIPYIYNNFHTLLKTTLTQRRHTYNIDRIPGSLRWDHTFKAFEGIFFSSWINRLTI